MRADFEGGALSSDFGVLLLRGIERQIGLTERLAAALRDKRHLSYIDHPLRDLLAQRIYQIASGYGDCVFHGFLPPNPREGCHPIHTKPSTQSTGRLPPNPQQSCHPSQALGALVGALRRRVVHAYATGIVFVNLLSSVARDFPASWAAW